MKKLESSLTNMVMVLTGVAVVMGTILALVYNATKGPKAEQEAIVKAKGIKDVMCTEKLVVDTTYVISKDFDGKSYDFEVNRIVGEDQQPMGVAIETTTLGFGGNLKVLVGFDNEGNVTGYTLLAHSETPGLGAKADKWFQEGNGNVIGKNPGVKPLGVSKDKKAEEDQVDAITASTITSRAFLKAINQAYQAYFTK